MDGAAIGCDGLRVVTELSVSEGLGEVTFGAGESMFCGVAEVAECIGKVVFKGECVAQAVVGGGYGRIEAQGLPECSLGRRGGLKGIEDVAQVSPSQRGAGRCGECSFSHAQGRFKLIALAGDEAEAEQSLCGARIGLQRQAVGFCGIEKIACGMVLAGFGER